MKSLSRVRLFATPWTAAYQAPPSIGFSRQEYWSGVPLPSPKCGHLVVSNSLQPHGLQPGRLLCPWDFPAKNIEVDCHFLLQGIFLTQGTNLCLLHCRFFTTESPEEPLLNYLIMFIDLIFLPHVFFFFFFFEEVDSERILLLLFELFDHLLRKSKISQLVLHLHYR